MGPFFAENNRHSRNLSALRTAAVLLVAAAFTAACAGSALPDRASGIVIAAPAGELAGALEAAAQAYSRAEGGAPVTVAALDANLYDDRVAAALLAGLDRYDMVLLPAQQLPRWARAGALRPAQTPPDAVALRPWIDSLRVDGALYGLPAQPDPLVVWFRADRLEGRGLGPPFVDWDGLLRAGRAGGGFALAGGEMDAGGEFLAALLASDRPAYDALVLRGEATPGAARALETFTALLAQPGDGLAGAGDFSRADALKALVEGRAGLALGPLSSGARLLRCPAAGDACQGEEPLLSAANLPGDGCAALGSLSAWAFPLRSARPEAAERFAAWLVTEEGARAWAVGGGIPPRRDAAAAGTAEAGMADAKIAVASAVLTETHCYIAPFLGLEGSDLAWQAVNAAVRKAAIGALSAQAAVGEAAEKIRRVLRQEGALK